MLNITIVSFTVSAEALPLCRDTVRINTDCTMLTPILSGCSNFTYDIIRVNGTFVQNQTSLENFTLNIYSFNFTEGEGQYIVRLCDDTTREVIVEVEDDDMASLAVIFFVTLITVGIFMLPRLVKRFSSHQILNETLRGLCIVFGIYLLMLDTVMVVTIADTFGLGINKELFRLLWIIEWVSYLAMAGVVLGFFVKVISMWQDRKYLKRMGYG